MPRARNARGPVIEGNQNSDVVYEAPEFTVHGWGNGPEKKAEQAQGGQDEGS